MRDSHYTRYMSKRERDHYLAAVARANDSARRLAAVAKVHAVNERVVNNARNEAVARMPWWKRWFMSC